MTWADLKRLRWSLALLLVTLLAAGVLVGLTFERLERSRAELKQAQARLAETEDKLARVADEERELRAAIEHYQRIAQRGLIGQEERLNWVEEIARLKTERKLLGLDYEIQPQAPASPELVATGSAAGPYEIMTSRMRLSLPLLHENDLLGFLDQLRERVHALLNVHHCSLGRATAGPTAGGVAPQLRAECELDWITLKERR